MELQLVLSIVFVIGERCVKHYPQLAEILCLMDRGVLILAFFFLFYLSVCSMWCMFSFGFMEFKKI